MIKRIFPVVLFFLLACGQTKFLLQTDDQLHNNLKSHIRTLASDAFEGRETGTKGEEKAYAYIQSNFKKNNLKPKGTKGYLQEFTFTAGAKTGPGTQLIVNSTIYKPDTDFYALPISSNGVITGYVARVGYGIYD